LDRKEYANKQGDTYLMVTGLNSNVISITPSFCPANCLAVSLDKNGVVLSLYLFGGEQ